MTQYEAQSAERLNHGAKHNVSVRKGTSKLMADCKPFFSTGNTMWGKWFESGSAAMKAETPSQKGALGGVMSNQLRAEYARELEAINSLVYVIFSYNTPIAWVAQGEDIFRMPPIRYSNTTTRHQSQVKYTWRSIDDTAILF